MNNPYSSITNHSACGICGETKAYSIESLDRHRRPLSVVICGGCGVVRNDPVPDAEKLSRFYADDYRKTYKGTEKPKLRHSARYFTKARSHIERHWRHYKTSNRILDIGSGSGEFLFLMQKLGKKATGLEPTHTYANFCRKRMGLNITVGEIDNFKPDDEYDHIRLCHVVEHLRDPVANLRMVSGWLAEKGTLYVEVPDFEHYCRTKTPGKIFHYGHIYNFDHETFEIMIRLAGLEIVDRLGPTSAFLRPTSQAIPVPVALKWPIQDKIEFYKRHKAGQLCKRSVSAKLFAKAIKTWREHWVIASSPDHLAIANHAAQSLRKVIPL